MQIPVSKIMERLSRRTVSVLLSLAQTIEDCYVETRVHGLTVGVTQEHVGEAIAAMVVTMPQGVREAFDTAMKKFEAAR